jgi:hypothetical protein
MRIATSCAQFFIMVLRSNEFGKLSTEELTDFESTNKIRLPNDYKTFLLVSNGGQPIKKLNKTPETIVTYILGMHNGDYYASLYKHVEMFLKRIPLSTFPIATDSFGNLFLMSVHLENYGRIFFWDHEGEPEIQDGHFVDNVSFVSDSFSDFVDKLN